MEKWPYLNSTSVSADSKSPYHQNLLRSVENTPMDHVSSYTVARASASWMEQSDLPFIGDHQTITRRSRWGIKSWCVPPSCLSILLLLDTLISTLDRSSVTMISVRPTTCNVGVE